MIGKTTNGSVVEILGPIYARGGRLIAIKVEAVAGFATHVLPEDLDVSESVRASWRRREEELINGRNNKV